jgi:hypothetical protein
MYCDITHTCELNTQCTVVFSATDKFVVCNVFSCSLLPNVNEQQKHFTLCCFHCHCNCYSGMYIHTFMSLKQNYWKNVVPCMIHGLFNDAVPAADGT